MTNLCSIITNDWYRGNKRTIVLSVADGRLSALQDNDWQPVAENARKMHVRPGYSLSATGYIHEIEKVVSHFDGLFRSPLDRPSIDGIATHLLGFTEREFPHHTSRDVLNLQLAGPNSQGKLSLIHINTTGYRDHVAPELAHSRPAWVETSVQQPVLLDGSGADLALHKEYIIPRNLTFMNVREDAATARRFALELSRYVARAPGVNDKLQVSVLIHEGATLQHGLFFQNDVDLPSNLNVKETYRRDEARTIAFRRYLDQSQLYDCLTGFLYNRGEMIEGRAQAPTFKGLVFAYTPQTPTHRGLHFSRYTTSTHRIPERGHPLHTLSCCKRGASC
ncbi:MAG TPA: hypothetical protein VJB12_01255, partial [Candidatus Nanoarchaeia archaeon]|nr:hypothetical protein [Candidatus Nanoarchaeia archaeon]